MKLQWQWHAEHRTWRADGVNNIHYNIVSDPAGTEGFMVLPSGHTFIAMFENTEVPIEQFKDFMQAHEDYIAGVVRGVLKMAIDKVNPPKKQSRRIILP